MSHVTTIDIEIHDLEALAKAAEMSGCKLSLGKETYRWYGEHVGDYPLPAGFTAEDIGRCEHAITAVDKPQAYEVGVVKRRDGKPGWTLIYDFWAGGHGMSDLVGAKCERLKQAYTEEVTRKQLRKRGYTIKRHTNERGEVVLVATHL